MTETMAEISKPNSKPLSPSALCHVVLRTTADNYQKMVKFYCDFLGGHVTHGNDVLSFITYDHEHHRIAIIGRSTTLPKPAGPVAGLAHIAFGFNSLADLAQSYEEKKAHGMLPDWSVNHGMSTSMYYLDPDGNDLEVQVDNFETVEEAVNFMDSEAFEKNPIGVDFDADEFVKKVRSGMDERAIKARPDIGERYTRY